MADFSFLRRTAILPVLLAVLGVGLAVYYYFVGEAATLPLVLVPHLAAVPLTLDSVAVGAAHLPVPANGYLTTFTHDLAGPFIQPLAAGLWLGLLAAGLVGWLAVVSMLQRPAFIAGTVPVIFLLKSLNIDELAIFNDSRQGFLILSLVALGGAAFGLHAFGDRIGIRGRVLLLGALMAGLVGLVFGRTGLPTDQTLLHLAIYATPGSAAIVAALVLWVGMENIRGLLWFNTQAERPDGRFGLLPLVLASLLYLGVLALYWWNDGEVALLFGLHLDPLVLLLPAVLVGGLGLSQRQLSYGAWVPLVAARPLYWLLVAVAAGALSYALATVNTPLLDAARDASNLALLGLGTGFFIYMLVNFGSLIQRRLPVYRVAFEPRRLPFYAVYVFGLSFVLLVQMRNDWSLLDLVQAGQYNQLGDLTRLQSEARPTDLPLALLAERYYAESGDVLDRFNRTAQLGRAALYRFRDQRQNEINALRRALVRQPDEKISLRLASLYNQPADFFDALEVLQKGRHAFPRSAAMTSDLAQLFTRSALTDSVARYLDKTEKLAPGAYFSQANQLSFLLAQKLYPAAEKRFAASSLPASGKAPAVASDLLYLHLQPDFIKKSWQPTAPDFTKLRQLDAASFAQVYHYVLYSVATHPNLRLYAPLTELSKLEVNAAYYEQLLFLQALVLHTTGQELAARQTLAPLTVGTSAGAAYYQYVLGLWQLQQAQYATAATQLGLAAEHGLPLASSARVWSLALAGQADSARSAARRLALGADSAQRVVGQRLLSELARAKSAAQPAQPVVGSEQLAKAQQAEPNPKQALKLYQQLLDNAPFNEAAVMAAARFYTAQKRPSDAYEALRLGLVENPESLPLQQAFVLAAADAGLAELAQPALEQLRPRLEPAAYANLLTQFAAHRAAHAAAMAAFSADAAPLTPSR